MTTDCIYLHCLLNTDPIHCFGHWC